MKLPSVPTARNLARAGVSVLARRPQPVSVSFILTNRCNFQCTYCDIPEQAGEEMTADAYRGAIDELLDRGLLRASFSGGEALLRRDTVDIVRHAHCRGLFTSMNSNGWLTGRHLDPLAEVLDMLVVSLDGPEAVHDGVRRRPGSYARVVETLRGAVARGLQVATITVVGPWNLDHLGEVLDLAAEVGFSAFFQPAYDDCFSHGRGLHPVFEPDVFARLAGTLEAAKARGLPVAASTAYLGRLARGPDFGDCRRCHAGRYFATVLPDGRMIPCHLTSGDHDWPSGLELGFGRAFDALPRPLAGPGCAIAPYQESDLIFGLDRQALGDAVRRVLRRPEGTPGRGRWPGGRLWAGG